MEKIYKGSSSSYSDIVMNIKDGKIYKGSSSSYSDIIANISNGKVYKGSSSSYSDVSFNNSGPLTIQEFVAVWVCSKICILIITYNNV